MANQTGKGAIVLFDGVCTLCHGAMHFIIDRDPHKIFRFASLQSQAAADLLRAHGLAPPVGDPDTIVLIEDGKVYQRSTAALRIAKRLRAPYPLLSVFYLCPTFLRDLIYRLIAKNRYRWFGRYDTCPMPTTDLRARLLDESQPAMVHIETRPH
jgi:predicted DCC family thiol-disulfide oxidoreductase YuxK